MVQHNVRLVVSNAKYFRGRGVDMQDLVVEGVGGLLKAVERFDVERGFRFSTYAYWWIRQVSSHNLSYVPRGTYRTHCFLGLLEYSDYVLNESVSALNP